MSVNVKQNGELVKIANNISMVQANWNETDTSKTSCIRNKPETLKTLQEINDNTDENALVSANAVKELADSIDGTSNIVYLTKADYEALPESKLTDGVEYRITDAHTTNRIDATDVTYGDGTVEDAISEVTESLPEIQRGTVKFTNMSTNTTATEEVTFEKEFSAIPTVVAISSAGNPHEGIVSVPEKTTKGFTIKMRNASGTTKNYDANWIAISN